MITLDEASCVSPPPTLIQQPAATPALTTRARPTKKPTEEDQIRILRGLGWRPDRGNFAHRMTRHGARDLRKELFGSKGLRDVPRGQGHRWFELPCGWSLCFVYEEPGEDWDTPATSRCGSSHPELSRCRNELGRWAHCGRGRVIDTAVPAPQSCVHTCT
jgi:hypothetical protein